MKDDPEYDDPEHDEQTSEQLKEQDETTDIEEQIRRELQHHAETEGG